MTLRDAVQAGRALAEQHVALAARLDKPSVDRDRSLLNFSEVTYVGDWSLRSALCRLAQPEPVRVGRVLESVRRLDALFHHAQRSLERYPAWSVRPGSTLTATLADGVGADLDQQCCYGDARTADAARLVESGLSLNDVVDGYGGAEGVEPFTPDELAVLPALAVGVRFEALTEVMTSWADRGPEHRPVEALDQACDEIEARLDELGVPRESGRPPRGSRSRG